MHDTYDRYIWRLVRSRDMRIDMNNALFWDFAKKAGLINEESGYYFENFDDWAEHFRICVVGGDGKTYDYPEIDEARQSRYESFIKGSNDSKCLAGITVEEQDTLFAFIDAYELLMQNYAINMDNNKNMRNSSVFGLYNTKYCDYPELPTVQQKVNEFLTSCRNASKAQQTRCALEHGLVRLLPPAYIERKSSISTQKDFTEESNSVLPRAAALMMMPDTLTVGGIRDSSEHSRFSVDLSKKIDEFKEILYWSSDYRSQRKEITDMLSWGPNSIEKYEHKYNYFPSRQKMIQLSFLFGLSGSEIQDFFRKNPKAILTEDVESYVFDGITKVKEMQNNYFDLNPGWKENRSDRIKRCRETYYYKCKYFEKMCFSFAYNLPNVGDLEMMRFGEKPDAIKKNAEKKYAKYFWFKRNEADKGYKLTLSPAEIALLKKMSNATKIETKSGDVVVEVHIK